MINLPAPLNFEAKDIHIEYNFKYLCTNLIYLQF